MAMEAFMEAIHPDTSGERKSQIEQQLLTYCRLDTYAGDQKNHVKAVHYRGPDALSRRMGQMRCGFGAGGRLHAVGQQNPSVSRG